MIWLSPPFECTDYPEILPKESKYIFNIEVATLMAYIDCAEKPNKKFFVSTSIWGKYFAFSKKKTK